MSIFNIFKDPKTGKTTITMSDTPINYINHAGTIDMNDDGMFIDRTPIEEYQNRRKQR